MGKKHGYLLPADVNPPDNVCYVIEIPNDIAYIEAFWGQLSELGYWWIWERDAQKRGKDAAARWRSAIAESRSNVANYGDICDMEITVNCGGGLCCPYYPPFNINIEVHVPIEVINEIGALPGGQIDDGWNPPSDDWVDHNGYLVDKCTYANSLADDIITTWDNLGDLGLALALLSYEQAILFVGTGVLADAIVGALAYGLTLSGGLTIGTGAFLIGASVLGSSYFNYFSDLAAEIDKGQLLCAMYGATTAEEAHDMLIAEFDQWMIDAGLNLEPKGLQVMAFLKDLTQWMLDTPVLEPLFDLTTYTGTLLPGDCSTCLPVSPSPDPALSDSIAHYWSLDETAAPWSDTVATTHLSVERGTTATDLGGLFGSGLLLSGSGNISTAGNNQYVDTAPWQLSVMIWWWKVDAATSEETLFCWGDAYNNTFWNTNGEWPRVNLYVGLNSSNELFIGGEGLSNQRAWICNAGTVPTAQWNMAVVNFNYDAVPANNYMEVSLNDGIFVRSSNPGSIPLPTTAWPTNVGGVYGSNDGGNFSRFDGTIDHVAIWDRLQTSANVTALWNAGSGVPPGVIGA